MRPALLAALALSLAPAAGAHGGNYSGPGGPNDIVPPDPEPQPAQPEQPAPTATRPRIPGGQQAGREANTTAPTAAGGATDFADDLTSWRYWWYYNSKPYLQLRRARDARAVLQGSDDYFLGARHDGGSVGGVRPGTEWVQGTVVPQLVGHLETESSQQVLTSALLSLARLEGDADYRAHAADEIASLLGHPDLIVVEVAAISLGILGTEQSAITLAALLAGGETGRALRGGQPVGDRIRAFAAYGLGQIGFWTERPEVKSYVVAQLRAAFDKASPSEYDVRVACLLAMGSVPLPVDPGYKLSATEPLIASVCLQSQAEWISRVLADKALHQSIRAHAPTALARLLASSDAPALADLKASTADRLIELLHASSDTPRQISQSAALALGQLGDSDDDPLDQSIRDALERASDKASDHATRNFSLISLAQVAGRPGTDGATPGAGHARKVLVARIERGSTMQRPWAALALGVLERALDDAGRQRSDETMAFLRATLSKTRSPELTSATAIALGILRDAEAEELLLEVLERTSDTQVRGYTMISLGLIQARGSLPQIEAILIDSKYRPELVQTAAVALALMHDAELVPKLIEMLHSNSSLPAQGAICFSLGSVGDVRAAQALVEMSTSPELGAVARGLAIEALGLVADRYDLPWNTELSANTNYLANPTSLSSPDTVGVLDLF